MSSLTWCYIIGVTGKRCEEAGYTTTSTSIDDAMDVIVTKRRNGLQRLCFQTLDDFCCLQSIFGLMVGIGIRAAPP